MYNAQRKFTLDNVFGGSLLIAAIAWTAVTIAFAPFADAAAPAAVAKSVDTPLMVYAAPGTEHSSGEVMTFPSKGMEVIVDKKYA